MQARDIISAKTLIALGADVNKINHFNMAALDIVDFMLARDPAHPSIAQMIKDVGGVSGRNVPIPQQPATDQQNPMDTGEQTSTSTTGLTHTHTHTNQYSCLEGEKERGRRRWRDIGNGNFQFSFFSNCIHACLFKHELLKPL